MTRDLALYGPFKYHATSWDVVDGGIVFYDDEGFELTVTMNDDLLDSLTNRAIIL